MGRRDARYGGLSSILQFWSYVRHPLVRLRALDAGEPGASDVPFAAWGWFVGISVSGSLVYGASLGGAVGGDGVVRLRTSARARDAV